MDVTSTPLLTDKEIIFGSAQKGLIALDSETLEEKWTCPVGDALVYTCPYSRQPSATIETSAVWAGDIVYVAASDGTVYGINKENGKSGMETRYWGSCFRVGSLIGQCVGGFGLWWKCLFVL